MSSLNSTKLMKKLWVAFSTIGGCSSKKLVDAFEPGVVKTIPEVQAVKIENIDFSPGNVCQSDSDFSVVQLLQQNEEKYGDIYYMIMVEWLTEADLAIYGDLPAGITQIEDALLFFPPLQTAASAVRSCRKEQIFFRGWILQIEGLIRINPTLDGALLSKIRAVVANIFDQDGWLVALK